MENYEFINYELRISKPEAHNFIYFVCFFVFMKTVTCIDKDKNTYDVPVSDLTWRPSVYGIVIKDDRILLVPQWDGYDLP